MNCGSNCTPVPIHDGYYTVIDFTNSPKEVFNLLFNRTLRPGLCWALGCAWCVPLLNGDHLKFSKVGNLQCDLSTIDTVPVVSFFRVGD
eukprot:m.253546 g.253546  ORF g.253546 m.253546 type:complete len:89 (+) comp15932_c0_seq3:5528-5794(+)